MLARSALGLALGVALVACVDPTPDDRLHDRDAGYEPADAAVVTDLTSRFLAIADAHADEVCRCAGDLATCRRENRADWDAGGRACLERAIAMDVAGFEAAIGCLEGVQASFTPCHAARDCADTAGRKTCTDAFTTDGNACLAMARTQAQVALGVCSPTTSDAGP